MKTIVARKALATIKKGSRIFLGTGCGEPRHLIRTLIEETDVEDVVLYQMLSNTLARYIEDDTFFRRFALKLFFISRPMRAAAFMGKIEYIPVYLSQIPGLFSNHAIGLDVALVQVSPPDGFGYCSLGISVDVTKAALENARVVIAQINPRMPRTFGDTFVHIDQIRPYGVVFGTAVDQCSTDDKTKAWRAASDITFPNWWGTGLRSRSVSVRCHLPFWSIWEISRILGLHTQLITDAFLPLFEKKVITNTEKTHLARCHRCVHVYGNRKIVSIRA